MGQIVDDQENNSLTPEQLLLMLGIAMLLMAMLALSGCDGLGDHGPQGMPGPSLPVLTQPATVGECPEGGTDITVGSTLITVCNGNTGATGAPGSNGSNGSNGSPGQDGTSCSVLQLSTGAVVSCTDGTNAYIANGEQGPPGSNTPPTSAVTVVPLCSDTTVYPVVFSEVGLCINNQLFGVYSENDGFLSYLPPGNYVSHGHGSSCYLTVQANCAVIH